jgi:hypothetical protein
MTNTATAPRIMVGAAASLLVFSLLSVIGVFSPWLSFGPISKPGIEADGAIVLITLVTPVIAGIIGLATKNISRGLGAGVFGSALLGVIICVYDLSKVLKAPPGPASASRWTVGAFSPRPLSPPRASPPELPLPPPASSRSSVRSTSSSCGAPTACPSPSSCARSWSRR